VCVCPNVDPIEVPTFTGVCVDEVDGDLVFKGDIRLKPDDLIKVRVWKKGNAITHCEFLHKL
jgi:hypothetical protein